MRMRGRSFVIASSFHLEILDIRDDMFTAWKVIKHEVQAVTYCIKSIQNFMNIRPAVP
jgi:hypothetical protein